MKKVWMFVVEGDSEEISLDIIIKHYFGVDKSIRFLVMNADVVADKSPETKLINRIENELNVYKLRLNDLERIIHIADVDGCFINESSIIEIPNSKIEYKTDTIECSNKISIINRKDIKKNNFIRLYDTRFLNKGRKSIKYDFYFFSCNLEHALHNDSNLPDKHKIRKAEDFSNSYADRIADFIVLTRGLTLGLTRDELLIWLQKDTNSLKKASNIYYLFDAGVLNEN